MQNRFGLLVTDVMPIYMIMPRYCNNYALFYQLLDSNLFTHRNTYAILREATSETYGPRVYSHHINLYRFITCFAFTLPFTFYFASIYQKYQKYYLYQISLSLVTVKGLTTPLSRWLRVAIVLCRYEGLAGDLLLD